jgi:hypothetical protein
MADSGDDISMLFLERHKARSSTTLAGRRALETRPLARADRVSISTVSTKTRQLNLKVTPEFYERVAAFARNARVSMPVLIEMALNAYAEKAR